LALEGARNGLADAAGGAGNQDTADRVVISHEA
jgi:hypothetical protein